MTITDDSYSVPEAKALHELGVRNHGWYMTEAEHRGVLEVIERLERERDDFEQRLHAYKSGEIA